MVAENTERTDVHLSRKVMLAGILQGDATVARAEKGDRALTMCK